MRIFKGLRVMSNESLVLSIILVKTETSGKEDSCFRRSRVLFDYFA